MDTRRGLLIAGGAHWLAPSLARAAELKDQPPLPPPLGGLRALPLKTAAGEPTTLGALIGAERPTVVSFWATWCAPCAVEGRELARIRTRFPADRLAMLGINVDAAPDPQKLATFRQRAQMNYLQALGDKRLYAALNGSETVALPRTYVFDGAGRPVAAFGRYFGNRTLKAINEAVAQALRG